ncbi:MAG: FadR/GntR family transcriptional regulator [Marinifilaceae bacterium]
MENIFGKVGTNETLSQIVERQIEEAIRSKKLPVGTKLPTEKELGESFGVSRTVLREALRRLSARGLIRIAKGSGTFVTEINQESMMNSLSLFYDLKFNEDMCRNILELRRSIEPEIARLAALNRNSEDLIAMLTNLQVQEKNILGSSGTSSNPDNNFHVLVAEATGNPVILVTMLPLYRMMPKIRDMYPDLDYEAEKNKDAHQQLFQAIKQQDGQLAHDIMLEHIEHRIEACACLAS